MKWVRAAFIILIVFIAAAGLINYKNHSSAQKKRQELLTFFSSEVEHKNDPSKTDLNPILEQGGYTITPPASKTILEPSNITPESIKEEIITKGDSNRLENNYKVIGRIQIDKINIDYPILDKTTADTLNISITKFCGSDINKPGNLILAGHHYNDGQLFGRLNELAPGDTVKLYDTTGSMQKYTITKCYTVEPTDLDPLDQETDGKQVITLITCCNKGKQRLIIKGIESN